MREAVQTVGWLACVVYSTIPAFWLMIHPFAERWRARRRSPYRVLVPLWMAMWVVMALITEPWQRLTLYRTSWGWVPAALLFGIGLHLYLHSAKNFSPKQLGGVPELQSGHAEQKLITKGIRARVRHPVYLAHLCEMLAWSLGTGLLVCWALTAFAMVTGAVMIQMEDAELEKRFGEEFRAYRSRVPAVFPKFETVQDLRPRLSSNGEHLRYALDGKLIWQIQIANLCCLAEYTTTGGPGVDDYFLVFATREQLYYEASFYSEGRDDLLRSLGETLGCKLDLHLFYSAQVASRIIWPQGLAGRPFMIDDSVNPEVIKLTKTGQI